MGHEQTLNVSGIIKFFGGSRSIQKGLTKHKICSMSLKGIEKWTERDTIPVQRLLDLKQLAYKLGLNLSIDEFTIQKPPQE